MKELKGIAWNHSRGFVSVVATAQRYEELHPEVRITWEKRSLQAFADAPLEKLAAAYDLIVMDHPHVALAAREKVLLPLDEYIDAPFLADQAVHSVGQSNASYCADGHQWTLATDAAAPIATWRLDLVAKHLLTLPETWNDVIALAKGGYVSVALLPLDALMHSYTFCQALGGSIFESEYQLAEPEIVSQALEHLKELASHCAPESLGRNPIQTAEYMTQSEAPNAAYCPFAYGYSNYSKHSYSAHPLKAGVPVRLGEATLRTVLGGAGLAVSALTAEKAICADYARFTASPETQKGLYYEAGGQPGHRAAWTDPTVNATSGNFFQDTLKTLDNSLVRPRHPGYMYFQDRATPVMGDYLAGHKSLKVAVETINDLYRKSHSN